MGSVLRRPSRAFNPRALLAAKSQSPLLDAHICIQRAVQIRRATSSGPAKAGEDGGRLCIYTTRPDTKRAAGIRFRGQPTVSTFAQPTPGDAHTLQLSRSDTCNSIPGSESAAGLAPRVNCPSNYRVVSARTPARLCHNRICAVHLYFHSKA